MCNIIATIFVAVSHKVEFLFLFLFVEFVDAETNRHTLTVWTAERRHAGLPGQITCSVKVCWLHSESLLMREHWRSQNENDKVSLLGIKCVVTVEILTMINSNTN